MINYKNITDLNNAILRNLHKIPRNIDLVVGIPRSGMLPANLIALYLNLPYTDIDSFIEGRVYEVGKRKDFTRLGNQTYSNILVVDDSVLAGAALARAKEKLETFNEKYNFLFCTVFQYPQTQSLVDIYMELVDAPRIFQWNMFHHLTLSEACVDIDGVLCVDPTEEENDDGERYIHFLKNAVPLYVPTIKIHTLVSCRLEKYRKLTEEWLKKNNIEYDNLVLLDLPDKQARTAWGKYGEYKAKVYGESNCCLFIESSLTQAQVIAQVTHKDVFCIETFDMINIPRPHLHTFWMRVKGKIKRTINSVRR
ncbi:phosphoribosyl transferase [Dysgonomonas sp. 216]|uniref:phosphoribosyltransferase n=1 Tax=Dysgonomonas sp. 216 TaxID=2302934 RepID=UPI0013D6AA46|nr:phosphoribosyltransferase family protein [Dysgonomonas sp. 216]NDW17545.1 phosphoribosyl transferase [Dysgonomonas sp. 216]